MVDTSDWIHGEDVSSWEPNWTPSSGDDFAIFKATEGRTVIDKTCAEKTKEAQKAGLVIGYYHFFWPGNAKEQADYFLAHLPIDDPVLLVCDWEEAGGETASDADKDAFMARCKEKRPDCQVGVYCNMSTWKGSNKNKGDFLWIAWLNDSNPDCPWTIWQYEFDPDQNWAKFGSRSEMQAWVNGGSGEAGLFGMTKSVYERRSADQ